MKLGQEPFATADNWIVIGLRIHAWFMKKMGLEIGTTLERVFLGLALCGEAGELANKIKKLWRDGETPELLEEIRKEIADVRGYTEHLAASFGESSSDQLTADKTNELIERWPWIFDGSEGPRTRSYQELAPKAGSAPSADDQNPHSTESDRP